MNERIEKFARQVDAGYIPRYDMWQMDSETVQKFAELIVRECMMVCQNTSIREDDGQTFVYSDAIQEHFRS